MPNELSGEALDTRFFEVCEGWKLRKNSWRAPNGFYHGLECPEVSSDPRLTEHYAMRWAREQGLRYEIAECADKVRVRLYDPQGRDFGRAKIWLAQEYGENFKEAFVRACVTAGETLNKAKGGA